MAPAPVLGSCPCWELSGVRTPHGDSVAMRFLTSPHGPRTLGSSQEAHGIQAELQRFFLTSFVASCAVGASGSPSLSSTPDTMLSQVGVLCPEQG